MLNPFWFKSIVLQQFMSKRIGRVKVLFFTLLLFPFSNLLAMDHPGDSIFAQHCTVLPVIDGDGADGAWNEASWVNMSYTWIPYSFTQTIAPEDFTGRFKVLWNKSTHLLYFLAEITDEKFVNGYVYTNNDGSYPSYDVLELFLDEDRPGSLHECNNNAFAYHITSGNTDTEFDVLDIFDPNNSHYVGGSVFVNYKTHFPEFKRTKVDTKYTWEFSVMVLKSDYTPSDDPELFKAELSKGKNMGLTMNYCDNDNSAVNPVRDNFFSSKFVNPSDNNSAWVYSNNFGSLVLVDNEATGNQSVNNTPLLLWVDEAKQLNWKLTESWSQPVIQLLDISGHIIAEKSMHNVSSLDLSSCKKGFYMVAVKENNTVFTKKIIL